MAEHTCPDSAQPEYGVFRRTIGAHLGEPNMLLLECGHEAATGETVKTGVYLCLPCGEGRPGLKVTRQYWEQWCERMEAV